MRPSTLASAVCLALLVTSCSETTAPVVPPLESSPRMMFAVGTVIAHVHWGHQGVPDKRVALVELGLEATTDEEGFAEFKAPIGTYTLRAYEINRGPTWEYIDTEVTVTTGAEVLVDIVDCLPCD